MKQGVAWPTLWALKSALNLGQMLEDERNNGLAWGNRVRPLLVRGVPLRDSWRIVVASPLLPERSNLLILQKELYEQSVSA